MLGDVRPNRTLGSFSSDGHYFELVMVVQFVGVGGELSNLGVCRDERQARQLDVAPNDGAIFQLSHVHPMKRRRRISFHPFRIIAFGRGNGIVGANAQSEPA